MNGRHLIRMSFGSGISPNCHPRILARMQAGDLFESLLKRSADVKDSSGLIPGHGGMLDRLDSWLFAAPAYYVFLRYTL